MKNRTLIKCRFNVVKTNINLEKYLKLKKSDEKGLKKEIIWGDVVLINDKCEFKFECNVFLFLGHLYGGTNRIEKFFDKNIAVSDYGENYNFSLRKINGIYILSSELDENKILSLSHNIKFEFSYEEIVNQVFENVEKINKSVKYHCPEIASDENYQSIIDFYRKDSKRINERLN